MILYMIRHGETGMNRKKVLQGRSDLPLSEDGIRQAEEAGEYFRSQRIRFREVWSSPLARAVQTAEIIEGRTGEIIPGEAAKVYTDERLLEMDYGPYEGVSLTPPPPELMTFFSDFVHNPAPDGMEPLSDVVKRTGHFLQDLASGSVGAGGKGGKKDTDYVLISTHAIALKGLLENLTPDSEGSYWSKYIGNCGIYRSELKDGRFTVPEEVIYRDIPVELGK